VVATRWSKRDLIGRILADDKDGEWTVVEMPAILPSGNPLWPEYWSLEELNKVKDNIGMMRWNAQYMQQPTSVEQAMVKPSDWIPWTEPGETKPPPRCSFVVQSWDTAHSAKKHANPSACTTWGVTEVENRPALVLLHAWQDRVEFPELKLRAKELYKEWKPDYVIIESQASGRPLMAEMRVAGVPVVEFKAQSGVDKITRVNAVTDLFKAGFIRYVPAPDTNLVIEQFSEFPAGSADDLVDSSTAALDLLKRQINEFRHREATEDDDEDEPLVRSRLRRKFY
jgi:predicted phage terminase large subunit-like protein